jgi:MFS family permease
MLNGKFGAFIAGRPAAEADLSSTATTARHPSRSAFYVVGLLMLANTLNHLDRQIISILAEPIKLEFALADWQLGVLTGLSFALLHGLVSLPLAHLADRTSRSRIVAACLGVWSIFTALGGLAQSYLQLLVSRVVVGVAEAGGSAPSQSLITDLVPRERRATALAVFSLGIPLGSFFGMAFGGILADTHGWRLGMIAAGLPGIALALLILMTVREPRRTLPGGASQPKTTALPFDMNEFVGSVRSVFGIATFRNITLGGACITFVNYSQAAFLASHFFRSHAEGLQRITASDLVIVGLSFGASAFLGVVLGTAKGLPGVIGTLWGGQLTDRLSARKPEWLATVPALATWLRIPLILGVFLSPVLEVALLFVVLQAFVVGLAAPAGFATVQGLVLPGSRALAASLYALALNVIGLGLGPLSVGLLSDSFQAGGLNTGEGLRWSLISSGAGILAVGGWFKWRARRSISKELVS